jgi:hypothetical protein
VGGSWLVAAMANGITSRVIIRDRATAAVVVDVALPFWASSAAVAGDAVLLTGYGDSAMATDAGLTAIDILTGDRRAVIAGGPFDPELGDRPMRGEVQLSPNGRLVAVNACGSTSCVTQVVSLDDASAPPVTSIPGGYLRSVTDESASGCPTFP